MRGACRLFVPSRGNGSSVAVDGSGSCSRTCNRGRIQPARRRSASGFGFTSLLSHGSSAQPRIANGTSTSTSNCTRAPVRRDMTVDYGPRHLV